MGTCPHHILEQSLENVLFLNVKPWRHPISEWCPPPSKTQLNLSSVSSNTFQRHCNELFEKSSKIHIWMAFATNITWRANETKKNRGGTWNANYETMLWNFEGTCSLPSPSSGSPNMRLVSLFLRWAIVANLHLKNFILLYTELTCCFKTDLWEKLWSQMSHLIGFSKV